MEMTDNGVEKGPRVIYVSLAVFLRFLQIR